MTSLLRRTVQQRVSWLSGRRRSSKDAYGTSACSESELYHRPLTADMKIADIGTLPVKDASLSEESNFCLMRDSPFAMIKAATKGKLDEFEKLYYENKTRLNKKDECGRSALHHAATNGNIGIINFILNHGGDIDELDHKQNTALHLAVSHSQLPVIDLLISKQARTNLWNHRSMAPIHVAVELNKTDSLQALLKHKDEVDPDLPGQEGATPLHYCAYKDHPECAEILLAHNARLCKPCNIGIFPLHIAAMHAAADTLEVMISHGVKYGYTREQLLSFTDNGKNMPLHTAVTSGNLEAVKVCLKAGAPIDAIQDDKSTAVHLAAAQGEIAMIKEMFNHSPEKTRDLLYARDFADMTPLHKAALFDRAEVVTYLVERGSDIDSMDVDGRTSVLLAAEKSAWNSLTALLDKGADFCQRDKRNRNMLHVIVKNGGRLEMFRSRFCNCEAFLKLFNEQDEFGCTPLHYASKQGYLKTIVGLLDSGAELNVKNHHRESPLHFAATYGRYNSCLRLIDRSVSHSNINEVNACGKSALHCAAENGHVKVVQLLLERGSSMNRDKGGNTSLHLAASNGYTHTMNVLLSKHPHLLNVGNTEKNTPLHVAAANGQSKAVLLLMSADALITKNRDDLNFFDLAIKNEHKDVCTAIIMHDRWEEALGQCSAIYGSPMAALVQHQPDVCKVVLDRCMTKSNHDSTHRDFHYVFYFNYLQCSHKRIQCLKKAGKPYPPPLAGLNKMVVHNREQLLSHPVCTHYLDMKWRAYGLAIHVTNLLFYSVFLASLTTFICTYPPRNHFDMPVGQSNATGSHGSMYYQFTNVQKVCVMMIFVFCLLSAVKEVVQMIQQRWKYLRDPNNLVEWLLYVSTALFIGPCLVGISTHIQWECGAIAVFFAWFNLLLFLQRFDLYGIYVVMFQQILKTLLQVLLAFSILIIAFGMSFYILMSQSQTLGYQTPPLSLMTTFMMMVGTIDYRDSWVVPHSEGHLHFNSLAFIFLSAFVLLMPILLMNLLIGLAVGDIESVQKQARLTRIAMQVELYTELERKLPIRILEYVDKPMWKVYPNSSYSLCRKIWGKIADSKETKVSPDIFDSDGISLTENDLYSEMRKNKQRLRQLTASMDKQHDLLKLIVQKMEIRSEADEDKDDQDEPIDNPKLKAWRSAPMRRAIITQKATSKWTKQIHS